jgi:hypothetical protein
MTTTPTIHTYRLAYGAPGTETAGLREHTVKAAYHQTDDQFTTFKDDQNRAVYSIRNDHLVSIERITEKG